MKDHEKPGFDFTKDLAPSEMLVRLREFAMYGLDECPEIDQLMDKLTPIVAKADPKPVPVEQLKAVAEKPVRSMYDMTNCQCEKCNKGRYIETEFHDDMDGVLHCDKCNYRITRHREIIAQ